MSLATAAFTMLCSLMLAVGGESHAAPPSTSMAIATNKLVYYPGEVVTLRATLTPRDAEGMVRSPNVAASTLEVFVAFEKERLKAYMGPGWGLTDALVPRVKTTQARPLVIETDLFYQVQVTDLDEPHATHQPEGLVFQRPGTYRIRAVLHDASGDIEAPTTTISVKPFKDVESPAIWRELGNARDIGYLVHRGVVPVRPGAAGRGGADGDATRRVLEQLASLAARYPNSPLAATLKQAVDANQAARESSARHLVRVISRPDPEPADE